MKAIFTLLATTAVAAATTLSGRTEQEPAPIATAAPAPRVPMLAGIPLLGDLFTPPPGVRAPNPAGSPATAPMPVLASVFGAQAAPEAQEPTPAPAAPRGRRSSPNADDERAAELDRLKARLAELERELAQRERAESARVQPVDELVEQTMARSRRARTEVRAAQEKDRSKVLELAERARAEARNAAETARVEARDAQEHAQAHAHDARADAERARRLAEEARARADELRTQLKRTAAGARGSLNALGYVDTAPQGADHLREELQRSAKTFQESTRDTEQQLENARKQVADAKRQLEGQLDAGFYHVRFRGDAASPLITRVSPTPPTPPTPPVAPTQPAKPAPRAAPSAPFMGAAPGAPMPGAPGMQGRGGILRSRNTVAPAQPGARSSPRSAGSGSGGPINIHVENGDVHIHNGGGGAQISVNGANPFSVDTTQPRGDKDRVSGAFAPEAVNEESSRTKGSKTFVRSFGVGDLRESFSGHAHRLTLAPTPYVQSGNWPAQVDAFKVDGDAFADVYYGLVDSDGAAMTWTPEQVAGVQQAYTAVLPEATADAVRAYSVYASSAVWQPTASAPSATSAPEGALEELLRLVREVHADVRALRTEMQTLRGEVEQAPDTIATYLETIFKGF